MGIPAQSEQLELSPPHTPHSSSTASPFGVPAQSSQSSPELPNSTQPQSLSQLSPFGVPAQSAQDVSSPKHTLHKSISLSATCPDSPPEHTPQLSSVADPPQSPLQSAKQSLLASASQVPQLSTKAAPFGSPLQSSQ